MRPVILLTTVSILAPFTSVIAQEQPPVKPGDQVRIIAATGVFNLMGAFTVVAVGADSLVVRREPNTWSVPSAAITRIEVRRGKSRAVRGALIGGLAGILGGAIIGAASYEEPPPCVPEALFDCTDFGLFGPAPDGPTAHAARGAFFGAVAGAAIGGLLGFAMKTHRWVPVPLNRLRVSVGPQRDGRFPFGLSVRF